MISSLYEPPIYLNPRCINASTIKNTKFMCWYKLNDQYIPIDYINFREINENDIIRCYTIYDNGNLNILDIKTKTIIRSVNYINPSQYFINSNKISQGDKNETIGIFDTYIKRADIILKDIRKLDINALLKNTSGTNLNFKIFNSREDFDKANKFINKAMYNIDNLLAFKKCEYIVDKLIENKNHINLQKTYETNEIQKIIMIYMLAVFVTELSAYISSLCEWKQMIIDADNDVDIILFKERAKDIYSFVNVSSDSMQYELECKNIDGFIRFNSDFYLAEKICITQYPNNKWSIYYGHKGRTVLADGFNTMKRISDCYIFGYNNYKINERMYNESIL